MKRKREDMQGEIDRLNVALRKILEVCERERHEQFEWPRAVGEIRAITHEALGYNVSHIEGPFRFDGMNGNGIPRLVRVQP